MPSKQRQQQKKEKFEFFVKYQRPEENSSGDPLEFYSTERIQEYAQSKALMRIQEGITKRAVMIADLMPPALTLDLGMGCGFASTYLRLNHFRTVGLDLNREFLNFYHIPELHPIEADMRQFGFRPNQFDFIISISAIQWILAEAESPRRLHVRQLAKLCAWVLKPGGKAIFQFYPKSSDAMKEMGRIFADTELFKGNFIIDNADAPKKRRIFLYLEKK